MDNRLLLITGGDYPIPECQLTLHQPTIKEISMIGEETFFLGAQMLTLNKMMFELDNSVLSNTNDFQIFMTIINQKEIVNQKKAVEQILMLLLPQEKINFTPQSILFSNKNSGIKVLDENNFSYFQEAIKAIFCLNQNYDGQHYDPANDEAKKIAEKIMRGRQKVAAEKNEGKGSIFVQYLSTLAIGLHIPITDLLNYTVFMIYDQIQRFGLFTEYDLDIRAKLAGGGSDTKIENWMKNMY